MRSIPSEIKITHSLTLIIPSEIKIAHTHSIDGKVLLGAALILALGGICIYYIKGPKQLVLSAFFS